MNLTLLADFYELTMMQGYFLHCPGEDGVFEMFFRRQPFEGGYTIFAGLAPLLDAIENMRFTGEEIDYLATLNTFTPEFLDYLKGFTFKGCIFSVREGSVVFPNEPLVRVSGNLMETQLIESLLLNFINFQSLVATKTARIADAAGRSPVLDFGLRRAQGNDGALSASRAAFIGGAAATSNTLAGKHFGIPVSGTMAHSWVMNFKTELESFETYARQYPDQCVLLVDTFDTLRSGIPNAIRVFKGMEDGNSSLRAIRIDSGDLEYLSKKAREMLDASGLTGVRIFASSDLDEYIIRQLKDRHAPIDAWGVGTRLVTGWGDPALTGVYKIVAHRKDGAFNPCIKISNQSEKITNPGIKNVLRFYNGHNQMLADLLYLEDEENDLMAQVDNKRPMRFNHPATDYEGFTLDTYVSAKKMLEPVMKDGTILRPHPSFESIMENRQEQMESLDTTYKRLLNPHRYKISLSNRLKGLKTELIKKIRSDF